MICLRVNTDEGYRLSDRRSFQDALLAQWRGVVDQPLDVGILDQIDGRINAMRNAEIHQRIDGRFDAVRDAEILNWVDDPFCVIFDQMNPPLTIGECRRQWIRLWVRKWISVFNNQTNNIFVKCIISTITKAPAAQKEKKKQRACILCSQVKSTSEEKYSENCVLNMHSFTPTNAGTRQHATTG